MINILKFNKYILFFILFISPLFIIKLSYAQSVIDRGLLTRINNEINSYKKFISINSSLSDEKNNKNVTSTVFLYQNNNSITETIGSGVLIKNKKVILTAKHVVINSCKNPVDVFNYLGNYIGEIKINKCIQLNNKKSVIKEVEDDHIQLPLININNNNLNDTTSSQLSIDTYSFQLSNIDSPVGFSYGLSGGPVFDMDNKVVGIISMFRYKNSKTLYSLLNKYQQLRITNINKDNVFQMDNKVIMSLMMNKVYFNVDLLIAPHSTVTNKYYSSKKIKDIIGFPNGIGIHYQINK